MAEKRHSAFWSYLRGLAKENIVARSIPIPDAMPRCKYCGSSCVVRYGYYSGIQRWWCKECRRKFADNKALPGMKTPTDHIAYALTMYYEGLSLNIIRRNLHQFYKSYPSDSTLYDWIERFTNKAIAADKRHKPMVGDVWFADETPLMMGNRKAWFWDIIDIKTHFMLASQLFTRRTMVAAEALMAKAVKKAGKPPKVVVSSKPATYIRGIELKIGTDTRPIATKILSTAAGTQLLGRFHSALNARIEIVGRFKNIKSARTIIQGWPVHYNYLRPHEVINDNTPAQKAGINQQLRIRIR
jgi:putative transposase